MPIGPFGITLGGATVGVEVLVTMLKRIIVGAGLATAAWATFRTINGWSASWGVDPAEQTKKLPGDELIPDAANLITRGITIDAPPEAVWPWLVQMGFGRAGWYSYDRLDMKGASADRIVPDLQRLAVGDTMPTHDDGGFKVRVIEPNRALVVYLDTALVDSWKTQPAESISSTETPGLAASGRFMGAASPKDFQISWAFVLEPAGVGGTRLIERTRGWFGKGAPATKVLLPTLGFGVFVMMQRQMVGIRQRVERSVRFDRAERDAGAAIAVRMATSSASHEGTPAVPVAG